jgi:hypothetical protein
VADFPESKKQSLRYLAAARFYLPMVLKGSAKFDVEEQYLDYLHNREFRLAMTELEEIALENTGWAEEKLFWREMQLAAESIGMSGKAGEYGGRAEAA